VVLTNINIIWGVVITPIIITGGAVITTLAIFLQTHLVVITYAGSSMIAALSLTRGVVQRGVKVLGIPIRRSWIFLDITRRGVVSFNNLLQILLYFKVGDIHFTTVSTLIVGGTQRNGGRFPVVHR
jgi:hypothetical protein